MKQQSVDKDSSYFKFRQWTVFLLTFLGYASFHACRQSFEDTKDPMHKHWGFSKGFEGTMDAVFLYTYAVGLFNGGLMGDLFDASKVHSTGLMLMAIIYFMVGAWIPLWNFNHKGAFIALWVINGLVQSVGWPTGIKYGLCLHSNVVIIFIDSNVLYIHTD